jgi:hypothetical protein
MIMKLTLISNKHKMLSIQCDKCLIFTFMYVIYFNVEITHCYEKLQLSSFYLLTMIKMK